MRSAGKRFAEVFHDAAGPALFERIARRPEYYLAPGEATILKTHGEEMARQIAPGPIGRPSRGSWISGRLARKRLPANRH